MAKSSYKTKKSQDSAKQKTEIVTPEPVKSQDITKTSHGPTVIEIRTEKLKIGIIGRRMETSKTPEQYIVLKNGSVDLIPKTEFLALLESNSIDTTRFNKEFYTVIPAIKEEAETTVSTEPIPEKVKKPRKTSTTPKAKKGSK